MSTASNPYPWSRRIAIVTIVAALAVLLAGPLINFGVVGWQAGLLTFVVGAAVSGVGGILSLVALLRRRGRILSLVASAAGLAGIIVPVAIVVGASGVPPIHDITTDTANPPAFVAITPTLRGPNTNPVTYDPAIAGQQKAGYPDLAPLLLPEAPEAVFPRAEAAARAMGWEIVAVDAAAGRIEATDTVPWWGFKDDVVIRLTAEGTGTRVDVRSKSRVGQGDLGVNAKRISDYLARLRG